MLRGDRLDDQALGYHAMNPTYSNTYDVEYYQNDVDNSNGLYGRINAAQRANYVVQPTGTCTCMPTQSMILLLKLMVFFVRPNMALWK